MLHSLYLAGLSVSQPAVFFSHTKLASATSQPAVLFLTTNQHQLPATASQTELGPRPAWPSL